MMHAAISYRIARMLCRRMSLGFSTLLILGPIFADQLMPAQALTSPMTRIGLVTFQFGLVGAFVSLAPSRVLPVGLSLAITPSVCEWLHLIKMGSYTTVGLWSSVLATSRTEASEALSSLWPWGLSAALVTLGTARLWLHPPTLSPLLRRWILGLSAIPLLLVGARDLHILLRLQIPLSDLPEYWLGLTMDHVSRSHPLGIPIRIASAIRESREQRGLIKKLRHFRYGARRSMHLGDAGEIAVLILGEASRASSWEIAGGDHGTTPRLGKRQGLLVFRDVLAPANATNLSLPLLLTRATHEAREHAMRETGLIGMFHEVGFQTWWISNQPLGSGGFGPIHLWTSLADSVWLSSRGEALQATADDVLLEPFRRATRSEARKILVVVHLLGSHWRYSERYPKSEEHFKPAYRGTSFPGPSDTLTLRNAYRNSIRVTDRVLDSILSIVLESGRDGVVAFVSDHGENLLDDGREAILHVRAEPTLQEVRVPMLFWATSGPRARDPLRWRLAETRQEAHLEAKAVLPSLSLLFGLMIPGLDTSLSPFSLSWHARPRYVVSPTGQVFPEQALR